MKEKKSYFKRFWIAIDQLANVVILNGDEDETISSVMGKRARKGDRVGKLICGFLNWFDKDHCEKSIEHDEGTPL
jgi:hypothetical protein